MKNRHSALLVVGLLAAAGCGGSSGKEKKAGPKFTIGKETTYVTGPVDKDGFIDYATALNERLSKGVTPANNANVLLWKAMGPRPEGARVHAEFFKWLGIPEPPERGDYYIDMFKYAAEHLNINKDDTEKLKEFEDLLDRAVERPWTGKEYPGLAGWLKANEKPLALVIEASRRPRYFYPLIPTQGKDGSSGLMGALLPGVQKSRNLALALAARAMLRVGEGKPESAWQDLLACHRLGRLVGQGATLIEFLVGIALEGVAREADLGFLGGARLSARQIENCLRDLKKLPPLPDISRNVDLGERFTYLDIVMMVGHQGISYLESLSSGRPRKPNPVLTNSLLEVDWDPALRNGNRWYDRMVAAMREKDLVTRRTKLIRIENDVKDLKFKLRKSGELTKFLVGGKEAKGEVIGNILVGLLLPAVPKLQNASDRAHQHRNNLQLAFALAWYKADHGSYPKKLEALAPKYLPHIPGDIFSGKALIYRPNEKGYLLYSVGVNGKDEQGRGDEDEPAGDDLSVRMPLPRLKGK